MNPNQKMLAYFTLITVALLLSVHFCEWHFNYDYPPDRLLLEFPPLVAISSERGGPIRLEYSDKGKSIHTGRPSLSTEEDRSQNRIIFSRAKKEYTTLNRTGVIEIPYTHETETQALLLGVILPMLLLSAAGLIFLSGKGQVKDKGGLPSEDEE